MTSSIQKFILLAMVLIGLILLSVILTEGTNLITTLEKSFYSIKTQGFILPKIDNTTLMGLLVSSFGITIFSIGVELFIFIRNTRNFTAEFFFFRLFILCQIANLLQLFPLYQTAFHLDITTNILFTRVFYFFFFFGIFSLFSGAISLAHISVWNKGFILPGLFLIALLLASNIPLSQNKIEPLFLHTLTDAHSFFIFQWAIKILALVVVLFTTITTHNRKYIFLFLSTLILIVGHFIMYRFQTMFFAILGVSLFMTGGILSLIIIYRINIYEYN